MANFSIHFAIGKRYIEKNKKIINEKEFYKGIISPDLSEDKHISHYTGYKNKKNLAKYLSQKVQLHKFLQNENIDSDYQKGVFIHLITDYLFFNYFFQQKYLNCISYLEFFKNLYYSYDVINQYINDKYNIDYTEFINEIKNNIVDKRIEKNLNGINILPLNKIDEFIEYVSNIDLETYKQQILQNNNNVFP